MINKSKKKKLYIKINVTNTHGRNHVQFVKESRCQFIYLF